MWLVEFVYGVMRTVNIELAMSVKDEGMTFLVSGCGLKCDRCSVIVSVDSRV